MRKKRIMTWYDWSAFTHVKGFLVQLRKSRSFRKDELEWNFFTLSEKRL